MVSMFTSFNFASIALIVGLVFPAISIAACTQNYTVVAGDTCDAISANQHVSTYQLAASNPDINSHCTNLQIGQNLCLRWAGADCSNVHVVEKDETCSGISQLYGLNSTELFIHNPNINEECTNIYIGEVLCVVNGPVVLPYTSTSISIDWQQTSPEVNNNPEAYQTPETTTAAASATAKGNTPNQVAYVAQAPAKPSTPTVINNQAEADKAGLDWDELPYCDELE